MIYNIVVQDIRFLDIVVKMLKFCDKSKEIC